MGCDEISLQDCEWKELPKNMNNQLHTLCSYMAMFPPSVPHYFIDKYSKPRDVVLDPFCGRGTTVLEASFMDRNPIANDRNPLAYVLTKAKLQTPQKSRVVKRIKKLSLLYDEQKISINDEENKIKMIFSDYTLKQLIFLKKNLDWRKSNVDNFITAMILGIIHGSCGLYLSVSMPNTFSMSPNYVKKYIKEHNLKKPERDVFNNLFSKIERCYQQPPNRGKVYRQDVRNMHWIKNHSVDLIVTSPPYLRTIRYGQYNWIRLWFLNKKGKLVDKKLLATESLERYCSFMSAALSEMKRVLKIDGKAILIIGDVKHRKKNITYNLAEIVWQNCAKPLGYKLLEPITADIVSDDKKVSKIWGEKKGKATKIDRILIIKR